MESGTYPMYDASAVYVLEAPQNLIHQKLNVIIGQALRANDVIQIGAHQMSAQVDLLKWINRIPARMKDVQ